MTKKLTLLLICIMLLVLLFPTIASADMGPKPSVVIDFHGLSGEVYYVTLLSSVDSTGPYSAARNSSRSYKAGDEDYQVFEKFLEYNDTDGYYFLQYFQNCSETNQFRWTYYPPSDFKILLYFPKKDSFIISEEAYDRYAFDSYYSALITIDVHTNTLYYSGMEIETKRDCSVKIISSVIYIALTIAIELLIALLFAFREKKQLLVILVVNLATQILLNVVLNLINYSYGQMMFAIAYVLLELSIFIIEAALYTILLRKPGDSFIPKWKTIVYALVANAVSFAAGLVLANTILDVCKR